MSQTFKDNFSEHERLEAAVRMLDHAFNYVERHKLGRPVQQINWGSSIYLTLPQLNAADILEEALADAVDTHIAFKRDNGLSAKSADILFGIVADPGR